MIEVRFHWSDGRYSMVKAERGWSGHKGNFFVEPRVWRSYLNHMEQDAVFQNLMSQMEQTREAKAELAETQAKYIAAMTSKV